MSQKGALSYLEFRLEMNLLREYDRWQTSVMNAENGKLALNHNLIDAKII